MKLVYWLGMIAFSTRSILAQDIATIVTTSDLVSGTDSIVFVTSTATATTITSGGLAAGTGLSSETLGAIIGGCASGFFFLLFSVVLIILGRNRHSTDFEVHNIGIASSTTNLTHPTREGGGETGAVTDKNVKRYNFEGGKKPDVENGPIISPIVIYTEKNVEEDIPLREQPEARRLSKYNYLSQAFSQMKTSSTTTRV